MGSNRERIRSGVIMQMLGGLMLIVALLWLIVVEDPFPMWLIIAGGGVMFIGVGASMRKQPG
jgi:drug/metabolite transporter superfamily protein YnfA